MARRPKRLALPKFSPAKWRRAAKLAERMGSAATRWMTAALAPPEPAPARAPQPAPLRGGITEIAHFGSNPGHLRMLVFQPATCPPHGAPLVVLLHGCGQEAEDFAARSGWIALARSLGFPLVLPEQRAGNHRNQCFHWYEPRHVGRGLGEAMSIRQMVRHASAAFGSDRRRVFIVGLSAGGAMAAAMMAAYPAVFAGGAVVAGMPVGAASSVSLALMRMRRADPLATRSGLAAAVRSRTAPRPNRPWPRLSIWQGEEDRTVDPGNAELLAMQWAELHGCPEQPASDTQPYPQARRRAWAGRGAPTVELWTIAGMGHGFPVGPGCGKPGRWVLDAGIPAARHIAEFWGMGVRTR